MKTKILIILIILIGLGSGGFYIYKNISQPEIEKKEVEKEEVLLVVEEKTEEEPTTPLEVTPPEVEVPAEEEEEPAPSPGEVSPPEEIVTAKNALEKNIPDIKNYPELERVFIDLYAYQGFEKEEIDFMKAGLKIYKEKPKLKEYPKEALLYLMSRVGGPDYYDADFFSQTLIPLAEEITVDTKDDLAAVKAIYKWVNDIMTYDRWFYYDYITPQNILREKRGACGEYAVLIAALSKATGIPARYVSSANTIPLPHAWVEVYINGDWIPIPSTGYLDYDHDGIIEHSDLVTLKNDKMVDIFIQPLYSIARGRTDITLGYNKDIVQRMITEVEDILEETYSSEAKENLELAKDIFSPWEEEESTKEKNRIGREAMEHLLRAVAIFGEDVTSEEIQVAFLEDFPIFKYVYIDGKPPPKPKVLTSGIIQSADIGNLDAFWEDFQETLVEVNPKVLYLFDSADEKFTSIRFAVGCEGIDFLMIRAIDELIKNKGLVTKLKFVLYWSDKNDLRKMEFLEYEDIEPVITLNNLFHDNALDFMWDFIGAVNSVKDSVTKMNFYLPPKFEERYDYYITAIGPSLHENKEFYGYSIRFKMVIETSFGELPLTLELHNTVVDIFPEYTNLIIVDELGNVSRPEEKDGKYYYSVCPSTFVNLDPGQYLTIEREGDFVKITETGGE